jgi:hypothetical protein
MGCGGHDVEPIELKPPKNREKKKKGVCEIGKREGQPEARRNAGPWNGLVWACMVRFVQKQVLSLLSSTGENE